MGAIQATVFDIHDTKSTPHSLLSSPRLLVSIYARTLEIDIWISMSHALLRESSPLSKRTWTGRPCPHTAASSAAISRVCLTVNFRWNEKLCWQHSPSIPWKRIFVVRPRDRTGGSVFFFYPWTTVLIVLNARASTSLSKTLLDLPWFGSSREKSLPWFRHPSRSIPISLLLFGVKMDL